MATGPHLPQVPLPADAGAIVEGDRTDGIRTPTESLAADSYVYRATQLAIAEREPRSRLTRTWSRWLSTVRFERCRRCAISFSTRITSLGADCMEPRTDRRKR
jgi:hypothetical protein